jgi:AraC-like DNA-binding protein
MIAGSGAGISLWSIFERDVDLFRRQDRTDISARLLIAGSNDSRPALVTPPDHPMRASSNPTNCNLHTRPRLGSIDISTLPQAQQAHSGLSLHAMRRVQEYVEVHLGEGIDPSMLAGVAGLSVHHFARQFKQSVGATPSDKRVGMNSRAATNGISVRSPCRRVQAVRAERRERAPWHH